MTNQTCQVLIGLGLITKYLNNTKRMTILTPPKSYRLVYSLLPPMPFALEPFLLINQTQFKLFRLRAVLSSGTHTWWKSCDKNVKLKVARNEICEYSQAKKKQKKQVQNVPPLPPCWSGSSSHITGSWPHTLLRLSSGCHFGPLLPKWNILMSQASSVLLTLGRLFN